ncbi:MAG: pentapeptide repeat-containing protein [Dongiaceae bacterium]
MKLARHGLALLLAGAIALSVPAAAAADLTVREVVQRLVKARNGPPADFAGLDLSFLDLTGLDFSAANLAGVNLFGSELDHADLSDANLAGAMLDRTVIIGTSFARANRTGVKLRRPAAFTTLAVRKDEAPNFAGANLTGAEIFGKLSAANFSNANLSGAILRQFRPTELLTATRTELIDCDFSGANLSGADLSNVWLTFADFTNANLAMANLTRTDLSKANLTGANISGANLDRADLDGAIFRNARGLDQAAGLEKALNLDTIIE